MSLDGTANMEYASLSGKIHTLVIDKSLTVSGACADAKAAGDRIEAMEEIVDDVQDTVAKLDIATPEKVDAHVNNTENPHKVTSEQVNAYSKNATLSAENRAVFGLDEYAAPNDIFGFLGKFNQHWWSVQHGQAGFEYLEKRTVCANTTTSASYAQIYSSVQYAKSITIDQSTGEVTMVDPQTIEVVSTVESLENLCSLAPCYITIDNPDYADIIYYMPSGVTYTNSYSATSKYTFSLSRTTSGGYYTYMNIGQYCTNPVYLVASYVNPIPEGETTYVSSPDRNAYPDSGVVDGLTYHYMGVPYENLRIAPKMVSGSYVGTGKYGEENPNVLEFPFEPQLVFMCQEGGSLGGAVWVRGAGSGVSYFSYPYDGRCVLTWDGNKLSWYSTESGGAQLNTEAETFIYYALG